LQAEVLNLMATRAPLVEGRNRFNGALATVTQAMYDEKLRALSDFPTSFIKRNDPKIPVVLSTDRVPAQIEYIAESSMNTQESLSLPN